MAALLACWSAWFWDQPCPSEIINLGAALPQTISGPFLKRLCRVCLPGDQADGNCNEVLNLFVLRAKRRSSTRRRRRTRRRGGTLADSMVAFVQRIAWPCPCVYCLANYMINDRLEKRTLEGNKLDLPFPSSPLLFCSALLHLLLCS